MRHWFGDWVVRRPRRWLLRRVRPGHHEGGFILIESLIAITVITVVMSAVGVELLGGVVSAGQQRAQQVAVQLADSTIEQIRSLAPSDLVTGRGSNSVDDQLRNVTPKVQTWLDDMDRAVDTTLPSDSMSGPLAAVPTVGETPQVHGPVVYTVNQYLGWCSNRVTSPPGQPVETRCMRTPTPSDSLRYLRAVVAVTWHGQGCPQVTDSDPQPAPCSYVTATLISPGADPTFRVNEVALSAPALGSHIVLTNAIGDTDVSLTSARTGGVPPFQWSVTGRLPGGLTLDPVTGVITTVKSPIDKGSLSGAPGDYPFTLTVRDAFLRTASRDVTWHILPPLTFSSSSARRSTAGVAYSSRLLPTGGEGDPYTFTDPTSSLPPGLTLSPDGVISGTPPVLGIDPLTYRVSITLGDKSGTRSITLPFTWVIDPPPLAAAAPPTQNSTVSTAVRPLQLTATGGTRTYTWSDSTPSTLPPGLSLDAATGRVTGTPTSPANATAYPVKLTVSDGRSAPKTVSFAWWVRPAPTVAAPADRISSVGSLIRSQLPAPLTCPTGGCLFSFGDNAPTGLTMSGTGLITGTIGAPAKTYAGVTYAVTDAAGATTTSAPFTWTVNGAPTILSPGNQTTLRARPASLDLYTLAGEGTPPYTFTATGLPTWLRLSAGRITGTAPTTNITTTGITVTVTDSTGVAATSPTFWWNATNLASSFSSQTVYSSSSVDTNVSPTVTGGTAPYSFLASRLPSWLTLDPGTGTVKGTAPGVPVNTSVATAPTTLTVTDDMGAAITLNPFVWYITDLKWSWVSTYASRKGQPVIIDVSAFVTGGSPGRTFTAAGLPAGLTMSSGGVITGTPTTVGVNNTSLTVTDSVGASVSTPVSWSISP